MQYALAEGGAVVAEGRIAGLSGSGMLCCFDMFGSCYSIS